MANLYRFIAKSLSTYRIYQRHVSADGDQLLAFIVAAISSPVTRRCILNWFEGNISAAYNVGLCGGANEERVEKILQITDTGRRWRFRLLQDELWRARRWFVNSSTHDSPLFHRDERKKQEHSLAPLYDVFLHSFNASTFAFCNFVAISRRWYVEGNCYDEKQALTMQFVCVGSVLCAWSTSQHRPVIAQDVSIPFALLKQSISIICGITRRCSSESALAWWTGWCSSGRDRVVLWPEFSCCCCAIGMIIN